ncbi:MAG TPA: hypothetical protein VFX28_15005 [Methylomirabilota bacterium]|nr:hypothetical protein [Methylomirabilota bacterium]
MSRLVFIVARDRPELAEYIRREFGEHADVDVIIDRRLGERRMREAAVDEDRRKGDRRQEEIDERLRLLGWAVIWKHKGTTVYVHRDETLPGSEGDAE